MPHRDAWTITHDFTHSWGGAEKCTEVIANEVLPDADVWVVSGQEDHTRRLLGEKTAQSLLPLDKISSRIARMLTPALYPAIRMLPATKSNILASSYAVAHLRRTTGLKAIYCHSPFRQIYSGVEDYFPKNFLVQKLLDVALSPFRYIDRRAATEADCIIATNDIVASRIREFWKLDVTAIIPPPIDTKVFHPVSNPTRSYFVWVGRIVEPYKRVSLMIEAFRLRPDLKLVIVGEGRDRAELELTAPGNVTFAGRKSGEELNRVVANASALIFPSADDFGMVPVEAMAAGTPVVGYSGGGARETILDGLSGVLFDELTTTSLVEAIERSQQQLWDVESIRAHAKQYSQDSFVRNIRAVLLQALDADSRVRVPKSLLSK